MSDLPSPENRSEQDPNIFTPVYGPPEPPSEIIFELDPGAIESESVKQILNDKHTTHTEQTLELTKLAFLTYFTQIGADLSDMPDQDTLMSLYTDAYALRTQAKTRPSEEEVQVVYNGHHVRLVSVDIALEELIEETDMYAKISPIAMTQRIERLEPYRTEPIDTSVIARLWVISQMPELELSMTFGAVLTFCRKHKEQTRKGFSSP
ncbi:MAG: hypothetical protein ABI354_00915 [Candidatus Saccharimonadales bacterium]